MFVKFVQNTVPSNPAEYLHSISVANPPDEPKIRGANKFVRLVVRGLLSVTVRNLFDNKQNECYVIFIPSSFSIIEREMVVSVYRLLCMDMYKVYAARSLTLATKLALKMTMY